MGYGGAWPDDAPVEVVMGPVPLERVARPAERLQVPLVTRPAPRRRRHVVHLEVPELEVTPAPVAPPLLPPEQYIRALPVGDESPRTAEALPRAERVLRAVQQRQEEPGHQPMSR